MKEPFALIAVDVQYDFLPGGALAVPGGDTILVPLTHYAREAQVVVASRDWHPENHFSFSDDPQYADGSWPPHCVQKTKGSRVYPTIQRLAQHTISKGTNANPPDQYSAFAGKTLRPVNTLEEILGRYPISTIVVGGLALDYCVLYTATEAVSLKFRTIVPLDATRAVGDPQPAIDQLTRAGVEVVDHYESET